MARLSPLMILPPAIFVGLAALFYWGMQRDNPDDLPSVFIDRPAPPLGALALGDLPVLTDADLRAGEVTVVNFWATWCPPCRAEHPMLLQMAAEGIRVAGVNMLDDEGNALAYLAEDGHPFFALIADPRGRTRVDWGVTGPPETFIVRGDGTVAFRFIGPLVGSDYEQRFVPELEKALAADG